MIQMMIGFRDGMSVLEDLWQVPGCLPPHTPVPKPGPCPGRKTKDKIKGKIKGKKIARRKARRAERAPGTAGEQPQQTVPARRRGGVRTALLLTDNIEDVNEVAAARAREITGRSIFFDLGGADIDIAREHAEGILRGLEAFPQARLRAVRAFNSKEGGWAGRGLDDAFAVTTSGYIDSTIWFNTQYTNDPAYYRLELRNSSGHLSVNTPTGIALHEFGHVIGFHTSAATQSKKIARALAAGQGEKPSVYVKNVLSDYAKKNDHELLAEGFADVMTRGEGASELSQDIFAEVTRRYELIHGPGGS